MAPLIDFGVDFKYFVHNDTSFQGHGFNQIVILTPPPKKKKKKKQKK
jgi:hypothetical protein